MSFLTGLRCIRCGARYEVESRFDGCPSCRGTAPSNLTPTYNLDGIRRAFSREVLTSRPPDMWRYREFLPPDPEEVCSLGEGMTPLIPCPRLGRKLGLPRLYLKDESRNPTGSFKDRLASVAVSMASRFGARLVGVSSTGNAGAAAAAYAARKGFHCVVLTVKGGASAMGTQIRSYGAMVVATDRKEHRWGLLQEGIRRAGWYPTSPFFGPPIGSNCYGVDGYKTLAFEICEQLGWRAPDWCVLPVAYGDALFGAWKGFCEWAEVGLVSGLPRMGAGEMTPSLETALRQGGDVLPEIPPPVPSYAASINVAQSTFQALAALRASGGDSRTAKSDELMELQAELAHCEGIYAEPSSMAALAAACRLRGDGRIEEQDIVVAVVTASGLKDTAATAQVLGEVPVVGGKMEELLDTLKRVYGYAA